ncbi:hypothetical protein GCM10010350_75850 [Streptomyces galilaeus]|nr:hypothetical protein GCM10010350_75850 [Streptomyces galilaeus]
MPAFRTGGGTALTSTETPVPTCDKRVSSRARTPASPPYVRKLGQLLLPRQLPFADRLSCRLDALLRTGHGAGSQRPDARRVVPRGRGVDAPFAQTQSINGGVSTWVSWPHGGGQMTVPPSGRAPDRHPAAGASGPDAAG